MWLDTDRGAAGGREYPILLSHPSTISSSLCATKIVKYITTQQRLRQQCELHDGHQRTSTPNISPRYVGEIFDQNQLVSLCFGFTVKLQSKMSI